MGKTIICGCDLHDRSMLVKVACDRGKPQQIKAENSSEGRDKLIGKLHELKERHGADRIVFVYEASGQGFGLYDELADAGIECHVLAPSRLPKTVKGRKQKTDEKDAQMLFEQCRGAVLAGNPLPTVWIPPAVLRDDRDLVRARLECGEAKSRVKLQVFSLLKRNRIVLPAFFTHSREWTRRFQSWLEETAEQMASGGAAVLRVQLARYRELHREQLELDRAVRLLSREKRYRGSCEALRKLNGVGLLTAMAFLTEMGDLTRFSNRRQVGAFLGLCPCSDESGEKNDRKGRITRQGPSNVRKLLCQAAWGSVRLDDRVRSDWERIRQGNSRRGKKAIVAVMRRLGIQMWHVAMSAGVDASLVSPAGDGENLRSGSTKGDAPAASPSHRPLSRCRPMRRRRRKGLGELPPATVK